MTGPRKTTPRGTPRAIPPPRPSQRPPRGEPLHAPVRLLTPEGARELGAGVVLVIGRDGDCDLVLDDRLASRRHARIVVSTTGARIEDTGSTNGVLLNCAPVAQKAFLHTGDRILIGTTELSVFSTCS